MISWSLGFTEQSPAWWSPGPSGSHYNHPPGDLLVHRVHTAITRLVISCYFWFALQSPVWWSLGPLGSHYNHPPGDLLVLWVHTTITCLVISWSFRFTQQSPAWWSPGPLGSHNNHPPGDLLVLWVHTTITCLVISWSFRFTQQSPAWWSHGLLGSHYNHPPGDLLVLWVHTKWSRTIVHLKLDQGSRVGMLLRGESHHFCLPQQHLSGSYIRNKTHVTILCPFTYSIQIGDPRLEIFPSITSLKAILPSSCMVSSLLVPYWSVNGRPRSWACLGRSGIQMLR